MYLSIRQVVEKCGGVAATIFFKKLYKRMGIKDKLAKEDGKHIYCYKQGAFWMCYE